MYVVDADTWTRDLSLIESIDQQMGEEMQMQSNPVLLFHIEELLLQAESELRVRDLELVKNIKIINDLYASYRYRVGRFLVKPIETFTIKFGLMPNLTISPDHIINQDFGRTQNE